MRSHFCRHLVRVFAARLLSKNDRAVVEMECVDPKLVQLTLVLLQVLTCALAQ